MTSCPARDSRRSRAAVIGVALLMILPAVLLACGASSTGARGSAARPRPGKLCGAHGHRRARYRHVLWITFENQSTSQIIGNGHLPYVNSLAQRCGLATRFFAEAHPSLPNYIAMTSGGTQGVTGDSTGPLSADNVYAQVGRSGRQWRHYAFGMPRNCDHNDSPSSSNAIYTAHHQSAIYYRDIARQCAHWDVGVGPPNEVVDPNDVRHGPLARALKHNSLPAFATIEPTDDGGNSSAGGEVDPVRGDAFLARWIPRIAASRDYRRGEIVIFITWDEPGNFGSSAVSSPIPTLVIAPSVPAGARVGTRFDHYSMLRTTEELLGLRPFLGAAKSAPSMKPGFHL